MTVYRWHWERVGQVDCFFLLATSAIPMFVTLVLLFTVIVRKKKGLWSQPQPDWSFSEASSANRHTIPAADTYTKPEMPADSAVAPEQGYYHYYPQELAVVRPPQELHALCLPQELASERQFAELQTELQGNMVVNGFQVQIWHHGEDLGARPR
jgi:hypothetical protein